MITLQDFLSITKNVILIGYCSVYIEHYNADYNYYYGNLIRFNNSQYFSKLEELEPYYDFEVVKFEQSFNWGELSNQTLLLREIKERKCK